MVLKNNPLGYMVDIIIIVIAIVVTIYIFSGIYLGLIGLKK